MTWADVPRVLAIVLYGLAVGETAWILKAYFHTFHGMRRLLPVHIVLIAVSLLGLEFLVAYAVATRFGQPLFWFGPAALVFMATTYAALAVMRQHITRKENLREQVVPLLVDPDETP